MLRFGSLGQERVSGYSYDRQTSGSPLPGRKGGFWDRQLQSEPMSPRSSSPENSSTLKKIGHNRRIGAFSVLEACSSVYLGYLCCKKAVQSPKTSQNLVQLVII